MKPAHYSGTFEAPWSTSVMWITWGVSLMFVIISCITLLAVPREANVWLIVMVLPLILGGCAFYSVRGYELRGDKLVIRRGGWDTSISLTGLKEAFHDPSAFKGSIKTFGNGGLFAFVGFFWNKRLGKFRAYVTDPSRVVILKLDRRTIVLSPHAPMGFLTALGFSQDKPQKDHRHSSF